MKPLVMAVTGASGARYARRLAQCLADQERELHLIISPPAQGIAVE
jgi:3-polyprenyl-4-hydroxybenzoate decarboxylase